MVKTLTHYMWFPLKDNVRICTCASIYSIENEESGFVNCILYSIYTIDNIEVRLVKIFLQCHYKHNLVYLRLKWLLTSERNIMKTMTGEANSSMQICLKSLAKTPNNVQNGLKANNQDDNTDRRLNTLLYIDFFISDI